MPSELILRARAAKDNPADLLELRTDYDNLKTHPAWKHFMGCILELRDMTKQGILIGERDRFGNDLTDKLRASYGILLQILAIPAQVEQLQKESELALIGINAEPDEDFLT